MYRLSLLCFLSISLCCYAAKPPELTPQVVVKKSQEIMKLHASHKKLSPEIAKRILANYIEELDPTKTYFIESDVEEWLTPSESTLKQLIQQYKQGNFEAFFEIHHRLVGAIARRNALEGQINNDNLPKGVDPMTFKNAPWPKNTNELVERILEYRSLQYDALSNMADELKAKTLQRIEKKQERYEDEMTQSDPLILDPTLLSYILKATASSLDTHTAYLTPDEASQFLINVQQRLFGIGVQLRDDINGFTVIKILEGGPSARSKELKPKDRIIAVDGEPVVGMEITDAVELIRGKENTHVTLTIVREEMVNGEKVEKKLDVSIMRGEVVLTETRFKSGYESFGDGVIAYLRLYSFYQDADTSSAKDLTEAFNEIKKEHKVEGVVLDLRNNSGGLLSQAVAVTGLFISKGIVVSIKDENGQVQHLRDFDGKNLWNGPLIILTDKASASAAEIVAQTLQDYGRAVIVGDEHTYGKGSFQTLTLDSSGKKGVNPEGEYKVTRGRYYTVSGKTPQLVGVAADVIVPSLFSEAEIGEKYAKYPLENDWIDENFDDSLEDIPFFQRLKFESFYKFNLQPKLDVYQVHLPQLKKNSAYRIANNQNFQNFLIEIKKKGRDENGEIEPFGQSDLQLEEGFHVMKDLLLMMQQENS